MISMEIDDHPKDVVRIQAQCDGCGGKAVYIPVSKSKIENAPASPVPFVFIHGKPKHALFLYIDRDLATRREYPIMWSVE